MFKVIALAFLGISICVTGEYFIQIEPHNEADFYEMRVEDAVTFKVTAFKREETSNSIVPLGQKVWWQYDQGLLEKLSSTANSITLKAVKEGSGELCATTILKNNRCQDRINLSIVR